MDRIKAKFQTISFYVFSRSSSFSLSLSNFLEFGAGNPNIDLQKYWKSWSSFLNFGILFHLISCSFCLQSLYPRNTERDCDILSGEIGFDSPSLHLSPPTWAAADEMGKVSFIIYSIDVEDYFNDEQKFNITHKLVLPFPGIDFDS